MPTLGAMLIAVEVLALAWALLTLIRLLRRGPVGLLLDFGCFLLAAALGWTAFLAGRRLGLLVDNRFLRALLALACSLAGFGVPRVLLARRLRSDDDAIARRLEARLHLGPRLRVVLGGLAGAAWLAAAGWIALVAVNVAVALHPPLRQLLRERSLVAAHLLLPDPEGAPAVEVQRGLARDMLLQRRFLDNAVASFGAALGFVAERTGTVALVELLRALRILVSLDPDLLAILVLEDPDLCRILDRRDLTALLADEALLAEIAAAAGGSPAALYRLGDDPRLRALSDDPALGELLAGIDLVDLRRRAKGLEATTRRAAPARGGSATGAVEGSGRSWVWPAGGGRLVLTVASGGGSLRVVIRSPLPHRVAVDGRPMPARRHAGLGLHVLPVEPGRHEVTITAPPGGETDRGAGIAVFVAVAGS